MNSDEVTIHVRFSPDGTVTEIGERPAAAPPQKWFDYLTTQAGGAYHALSGGRGIFRVSRADVERFKAAFGST